MKHHILYSFRRCPYAMRARLALWYTRMPLELREIDLKDKPEHMVEISPKATVPVLLTNNGTVIDESLDIMKWALHQNDPDNWQNADHRDEIDMLITRNDGPFKKALDHYKYPNRYPDEDCSGAFEQALLILKDLNNNIKRNNGYLIAETPTLADFAIFPFIRQFANVNNDAFKNNTGKNIQTWLEKHLSGALFENIIKKHKPWKPEDTPLLIHTDN